jgi:RNA-directed DNA polymerase
VKRSISTLGPEKWTKPAKTLLEERVFNKQMKLALLAQESGMREVFKLQEKLARTYDFRYLAVLKAFSNKGGKTPGIDNMILETDQDIEIMVNKLLEFLNRPKQYRVSPRVYIPKSNGGIRPLGIPTDRCMQSLVKLILEPVTETTSDLYSFGFRKNRSAKNALAEVRYSLRGEYEDKFVIDADIKGFFDNISHE